MTFKLQKIDKIFLPHPYCITSRHVAFASDHRGGMLTAEAIEASGASCGMRGCCLPYNKHESAMTLFITVADNKDLNSIPGLHAYLFSNKQKFIDLGIEGFAFPNEKG